jgi:hypothetical protein
MMMVRAKNPGLVLAERRADALDEPVEDRLASDPYANVFFSKDRIEKVIEPIERDEWGLVSAFDPDSTSSGSHREEAVKIMGRGTWMSGCPEGSEYIQNMKLV